jgi:hypothetical protein
MCRGGTRNQWTQAQLAEAGAGNVELIYQLGINHMVLCFGCNQAKKAVSLFRRARAGRTACIIST